MEQVKRCKEKLQILLNKSINDDLLIQALTIELAAARQVLFLFFRSSQYRKIMLSRTIYNTESMSRQPRGARC